MPTEAKDRFLCIECSVQVVVGSEAQVQSTAVRFQREQRLCTRCMHKREKGTKEAEKHIRESVRTWRDRPGPVPRRGLASKALSRSIVTAATAAADAITGSR